MEPEDYLQAPVAIAVAVSAVIFSPPVRRLVRRGAVYGLAGALMAGDALAAFSRGVGHGIQQAAGPSAQATAQHTLERAKASFQSAMSQARVTAQRASGQGSSADQSAEGQASAETSPQDQQ
jgi:hypothetical protein